MNRWTMYTVSCKKKHFGWVPPSTKGDMNVSEEKPKLSNTEIKALINAYSALKADAVRAKEALDTANQRVNDICKDLAERVGKGWYSVQGQRMMLTSRKSKGSGEGGKESFYFRAEGSDEVLGGD